MKTTITRCTALAEAAAFYGAGRERLGSLTWRRWQRVLTDASRAGRQPIKRRNAVIDFQLPDGRRRHPSYRWRWKWTCFDLVESTS